MPKPTFPPDPWVGVLLRRLLGVAVLFLLLAHLGPRIALPVGSRAEAAPGSPVAESRVLPTLEAPTAPSGPGVLLAPFETDDVESSEAGWAILDRSAGSVLVLDTAGTPVRRTGRRGGGPGELERPLDVALSPGGDVAVLDASGQRVDLLPAEGPPLRVAVPAPDCRGTFGDDIVHHAAGWWLARRCFDGPDADLEVFRIVGGLPVRIERRALTRMNTDPHLTSLLVAVSGTLYAGSNREPCLAAVPVQDPTQPPPPPLCLPRPPALEIPDSASDRMFRDLARRAAAAGIDLQIPTHYPGVVEVRSGGDGVVVRTILADGTDAWAVEEADTLRILAVGSGARVEPGRGRWLFLRDDAAGLRVWTRPPS